MSRRWPDRTWATATNRGSSRRTRPGSPACRAPSCNGGLAEVDLTGLRYYRCHVGHQYGPQSLEAAQREAVEAKLWAAAAALEEHAALARHLAGRSAAGSGDSVAERYRQAADRSAHTARSLLRASRTPSSARRSSIPRTTRGWARRGSPERVARDPRGPGRSSFRNAGSCSGNVRRCAGRAPRSCRGAGTPSGWRSRRPSPAPGRRPGGPGARAPGVPGAGTPAA